jgi:hypothetical protein
VRSSSLKMARVEYSGRPKTREPRAVGAPARVDTRESCKCREAASHAARQPLPALTAPAVGGLTLLPDTRSGVSVMYLIATMNVVRPALNIIITIIRLPEWKGPRRRPNPCGAVRRPREAQRGAASATSDRRGHSRGRGRDVPLLLRRRGTDETSTALMVDPSSAAVTDLSMYACARGAPVGTRREAVG